MGQFLGKSGHLIWVSVAHLGCSGTSAPIVSDRNATREQPLGIKTEKLGMGLEYDSGPRAPMGLLLTGLEPANPHGYLEYRASVPEIGPGLQGIPL